MTKEEYGKIIDNEIERLTKESNELINQIEFYKKVEKPKEEIDNLQYQFDLVSSKLIRLKQQIGVHIRARIEAMSDVELEEIKKERIENKRFECDQKQRKVTSEEQIVKGYNLEFETLSKSGNSSPENIEKGKKISENINYADNRLAAARIEYNTAISELDELKSLTPSQMKNKLLAETEYRNNIDSLIEMDENIGIDLGEKDYKKAQELIALRSSLTNLQEKKKSAKITRQYFLGSLPHTFAETIKRDFSYGSNNDTVSIEIADPDRLLDYLDTAKENLTRKVKIFDEKITVENLQILAKEIDTDIIDFEFLEKNKINTEELKDLVDRKKALSKKLFKTDTTRKKIEAVDNDIYNFLSESYDMIRADYNGLLYGNFYQKPNEVGLHSEPKLYFTNLQTLSDSIKRVKALIQNRVEDFNLFYDHVLKHKQQLDKEKKEIVDQIEQVQEKIKAISGKEEHYGYAGNQYEHVIGQASYRYQTDLLKKIKEEAQNQADQKEAEIRRISLQELHNMRKQVLASNETTDIDANGIKK